MRRRFAAGLAAGAALTLAACGGLATSSPVQPGLEVGSVRDNPVRVVANGPLQGSSPEDVVGGFIRAAAASDDQYQIARSFLAATPAPTWRPDSSVVVFTDETSLSITKSGQDLVTAVAKATARIDGNGRYRELPPGSSVKMQFGLRHVAGEWRISSVPEGFGIWLSEADLERLYDPYRVYYVSAAERRLVPDIRWFPRATGLATRLARAVIAGVPDYLHGAVRTEVPAGSRLAVDAVTVDSGTAKVDLTASGLGSDPARRQGMAAQFLATVQQAPGVQRIRLQQEGTDIQMPGGETTVSSLSALGFPTPSEPPVKPVLRTGSTLVRLDPEQVTDSDGKQPPKADGATLPSIATGWAYLAMSRTGTEIAAVGGDRAQLSRWRGKNQVLVPAFGVGLTSPTYDRQDVLWVGGLSSGVAHLWAVNTSVDFADATKSRPQAIEAGWLSKRLVTAVRLSPDGQRIAVISTARKGGDPHLDVAGVVRQPNGLPTSVGEPLTLAPALTLMRDLVWTDDTTLAVLGRKASSQVVRPWFVPLGGPLSAGPEIAGAQAITTVNGERGLVVVTDKDEVLIRAGNRWQSVGKGSAFMVAGR
jgi:hypothetical protein